MESSINKEMVVIYQWPPAQRTESIFPRSVVLHRICHVACYSPTIVNVGLPKADGNFSKELNARLAHLPLLEVNGTRINTSRQIIEFFVNNEKSKEIKQRLVRLDHDYSHITQQWANESFINSLVYSRWNREENFKRFSSHIQWGESYEATKDRVDLLRKEVLKYLNRTPMGGIDEDRFLEMIRNQLWSLDRILSTQEFMEPLAHFPTMTDLYIFMVVQGFLSPALEESTWIPHNYGHLYRWYLQVNELTKKQAN